MHFHSPACVPPTMPCSSSSEHPNTIGDWSRDLPVCSTVPQPLSHCMPPSIVLITDNYACIIHK
jgi:hypothetical protein